MIEELLGLGMVPIKSWCRDIENEALEQAINLSKLPFVEKHVALMPDCHSGYGMPIGGVIACKNVIVPNAVGVDIGCGMMAVKTTQKANEIEKEQVEQIVEGIKKVVPVGFKHQNENQFWKGFDDYPDLPVIDKEIDSARKQLGTLGGGNHFIEIQKGDDGFIWLMLHSGSRNIGLKIAKEYHSIALEQCEKWYSNITSKDLSFLPVDSKEGANYIAAMNFALSFALANRSLMMSRVKDVVYHFLNCGFEQEINIHHNYASLENHYGRNLWIHRKGATSAKKGELGIIPGSMGTPSYIVKGLGNRESFQSCSHGAGRKMSRTKASEILSVEECNEAMKNVVFSPWSKNRKGNIDLGEAPQAYKDIESVIEAELDLIEPVVKLLPLGVVKG